MYRYMIKKEQILDGSKHKKTDISPQILHVILLDYFSNKKNKLKSFINLFFFFFISSVIPVHIYCNDTAHSHTAGGGRYLTLTAAVSVVSCYQTIDCVQNSTERSRDAFTISRMGSVRTFLNSAAMVGFVGVGYGMWAIISPGEERRKELIKVIRLNKQHECISQGHEAKTLLCNNVVDSVCV